MPISRGKSIAKSNWIQDMGDFYGWNIFLAETSATSGGLDSLLDRITATVSVHVGADDAVTPPAMARWIGRRLAVRPQVHDGIGHELAIRRWADLLLEAAAEG